MTMTTIRSSENVQYLSPLNVITYTRDRATLQNNYQSYHLLGYKTVYRRFGGTYHWD
jgi:hypothetical protein